MATTSWNDAEDVALQGLPWRAQVLYLRGIRRFMNYQTGIAGRPSGKIICTQMLSEITEVRPPAQSREKFEKLDRSKIRAIIQMLVRAGLVSVLPDSNMENGYIFFCILASRGQSANFHNNPTATPIQQPCEVDLKQAVSKEQQPNSNHATTTNNRNTGNNSHLGRPVSEFKITQEIRDYARMHGLPNPDDVELLFREIYAKKLSEDWEQVFRIFLARQRVQAKERNNAKVSQRQRSPAQILADGCRSAFEPDHEG